MSGGQLSPSPSLARRAGVDSSRQLITAGIRRSAALAIVIVLACTAAALPAESVPEQDHDHADRGRPQHLSLADTRTTWPTRAHFVRVVTMRDYNTRVVLLGTLILGVCAGTVGSFLLLRKRSLVGDVVSHSALPGVAVAFLIGESAWPGQGKSMPLLLAGALIAGLTGVVTVTAIRKYTRIKEDAALAIVLSTFFGVGIALFTIIQNIPTGSVAGLNHFIFGKAASMVAADVRVIAWASALVILASLLLFKEFSLLCFDERYAITQGWPATTLDLALMVLVAGVTVIAMQSVGLLLAVALLIIPAAAARFWTDRLHAMVIVSAMLGGASAFLGVMASALFARLAAGAIIVLVGSMFFIASMLIGARRGVLLRWLRHRQLQRRIGHDDLLRAMYEALEAGEPASRPPHLPDQLDRAVTRKNLLAMRSWSPRRLERLGRSAYRAGLIQIDPDTAYRLTKEGAAEAQQATRNHRLWEIYLITQADVAPSHVDRDADQIEHVLEPAVIQQLEAELSAQYPDRFIPPSPHAIEHQHAPSLSPS